MTLSLGLIDCYLCSYTNYIVLDSFYFIIC